MMFSINDADWQRMMRGAALPDSFRIALNHLGANYQRFASLVEQRRSAADIRGDLQAVARQAAKLLRELSRLDDAARRALFDTALPDAGPTPRRDALARLEHHTVKVSNLNEWLNAAASRIPADQPGPVASAELLRWLTEGFAYAYAECVGTPMTSEPAVIRLLGDFVALVDPKVTGRSLAAARKTVLRSLHN